MVTGSSAPGGRLGLLLNEVEHVRAHERGERHRRRDRDEGQA